MKVKYFMRGLGLGVLLTTLILSFAFRFSDSYKMSQDKIIAEAKKLGLVEKDKDNNINIKEIIKKDKDKDKDKEELPSSPLATEASKEKRDIQIEIKSGMSSEDVTKLLLRENIIKDQEEFNEYIVANGYARKIKIGKFSISTEDSYEDIVQIITN